MSLTVKAFLSKDGKWDAEIRRFQVPADVSSNFAYLHRKLCEIFPLLKQGKFSIYWKDSDGDLVAFSTDEELTEALGHVSDGIFKVFMATNGDGDAQPNRQDDGNQIHPGVMCDGCEGSIRGLRYKCLVCPDFDLCKICEGKGMHIQHDMMKITTPCGLPGFPGFPFGQPGPHGPQGPFVPPPDFRRWMQKFMNGWHKKNAPERKPEDEKEKGDNSERMKEDGKQGEQNGEEFLRNVGECVANILDSFGIDVDVDVEHKDKTPANDDQRKQTEGEGSERGGQGQGASGGGGGGDRCGRQQPGMGPWGMWGWGAGGECPPWMRGKCGRKGENKGDAEKDATKEPQPATSMETEVPKSQEKEEQSSVKMDTQTVDPPPQRSPSDKENGWTVLTLNEEPKIKTDSAVPPPQPQARTEPPQPTPQEPLYPPADPAIVEALQQMMAMGFNNDGGWLNRLLEAKNGDIIQVLDAIKPVQRRRADGYAA